MVAYSESFAVKKNTADTNNFAKTSDQQTIWKNYRDRNRKKSSAKSTPITNEMILEPTPEAGSVFPPITWTDYNTAWIYKVESIQKQRAKEKKASQVATPDIPQSISKFR